MNTNYCYEKCERGKAFADNAIWKCESALDASFEFIHFVEDCFKTCPYRDFHKEAKSDE